MILWYFLIFMKKQDRLTNTFSFAMQKKADEPNSTANNVKQLLWHCPFIGCVKGFNIYIKYIFIMQGKEEEEPDWVKARPKVHFPHSFPIP